jgi:electron transport complex protein RnfE
MGLGFTAALTIIGLVRELIGAGTAFDVQVLPDAYTPISIFILAPGAFFVLAILTALQNKLKAPSATNVEKGDMACGGDCAHCGGACGASNHNTVIQERAEKEREEAERKRLAVEAAKKAKAEAEKKTVKEEVTNE